ncbi:reductase, partial [Metarhizium majus ARSEF 297]
MTGDVVLLTGATGMIGFKTLVELLENGYTVRAAVRNQAGFDRISSLPSLQKYKPPQLTSFIVPDITVPGAYDEAVKGAKYIVHVASPIPGNNGQDHETSLIRPAIQGTVGILESALKTTGIERAVITASVASIASSARMATGEVIDGRERFVLFRLARLE